MQKLPYRQGKCPPQNGGCWYCHNTSPSQRWSNQFDTSVHLECVVAVHLQNPDDKENIIFCLELGVF